MKTSELEAILKQINDAFKEKPAKEVVSEIIASDYSRNRARMLSYLSTGTEDNWMCFKESDL